MACNVPLNDRLARVEPASADVAWPAYVAAWLRWNHVRTVMGALALGAFAWGLFGNGGQAR